MNMRVTLNTLNFSQLQSQPLSLSLHGLRPVYVGVSDRQLRNAGIALRRELKRFKVFKFQCGFASRALGCSICFKVSRWFKVFASHVERQTPPTAEILEPLGRRFSWLASNLELVL